MNEKCLKNNGNLTEGIQRERACLCRCTWRSCGSNLRSYEPNCRLSRLSSRIKITSFSFVFITTGPGFTVIYDVTLEAKLVQTSRMKFLRWDFCLYLLDDCLQFELSTPTKVIFILPKSLYARAGGTAGGCGDADGKLLICSGVTAALRAAEGRGRWWPA